MAGLDNHFKLVDFSSYWDFQQHVKATIDRAETCKHIVYEGLGMRWAEYIFQYLNETFEPRKLRKNYNSYTRKLGMIVNPDALLNCTPKWFDSCLRRWIQAGIVPPRFSEHLVQEVGSLDFKYLVPPYTGSRKEYDFSVTPRHHRGPSIVIQSGWRESEVEMLNDMTLCFLSHSWSSPEVVITITWTKLDATRVAGTVSTYFPGKNDVPYLVREIDIFPRRIYPLNQELTIHPTQLFKAIFGVIVNGFGAGHFFVLYIHELRAVATEALNNMGFVPA